MGLNLQSMTGNDKKKASYFESGFKGSSDLSNLKNDASKYYKNLTSYNRGANSYGAQLSADYNKYRNAKPFRYDLSSDMLYKQYKDQYQLLGQQAMMDTMGQPPLLREVTETAMLRLPQIRHIKVIYGSLTTKFPNCMCRLLTNITQTLINYIRITVFHRICIIPKRAKKIKNTRF